MKYFFLLFLLIIPLVDAWNWDTHPVIIESVFYRLDDAVRERLSLDLMKEGSIIPDKIFKDFTRHGFPRTIPEAEQWLQSTKNFLDQQQYENASLSFGIAGHYITDSFAAPHSISGEPYALHQAYERQASYDYSYADCISGSFTLGDLLYTGSQQGKTWGMWVETRDKQLSQESVRQATLALTVVALQVFNSSCSSFHTEIVEERLELNGMTFLLMALVVLGFTFTGLSLRHDLKNYRK